MPYGEDIWAPGFDGFVHCAEQTTYVASGNSVWEFGTNKDSLKKINEDYNNPIQISIYEDHMYIWNDGQMPENLRTTESLFAKHSSKPFNPKLAHVFFISGMIEAWGRGFDKIKTACDALYHTPVPEYDITADGIMVYCRANELYLRLTTEDQLGIDESILSRFRDDERKTVIQIMELISQAGSINNAEARAATGKSKPTVTRLLAKMRDQGLLISEGAGPAIRYRKSDQRS